jgi:hypothetical protein
MAEMTSNRDKAKIPDMPLNKSQSIDWLRSILTFSQLFGAALSLNG